MASLWHFLVLSFIVTLSKSVESARILGFFPSPSKSHLIVHCGVAEALAEAGHNVTVVASMPNVNQKAKYNFIQMDFQLFDTKKTYINNKKSGKLWHIFEMSRKLEEMNNNTLANAQLKRFMQAERNSFDLLVLGYAMNDVHMGLAAHFNCPLVLSFMLEPSYLLHSLVGNPTDMSYLPTFMSGLSGHMNFWQRVQNSMYLAMQKYILGGMYEYLWHQSYKHHFPSEHYPSLAEMRKKISLVFVNHHHISQGPIRPTVPSMIDIGGIHIKHTHEPLPDIVRDFMDSATNGVIYISFGTMISESAFDTEKAKIMFEVLSKRPQRVLWKWDDSLAVPGKADNILYSKWLPQNEVLSHGNTKLFITHGGQGSVVESEFHGVPMLGLPLASNLEVHVNDFVKAGYGISLQVADMTTQTLGHAIDEVISETKYKQAVQRYASLYRDRPMTAPQTVVYWIEYVLRHRGAKHLQSPAVNLNFIQLMSLDVIAFLVGILAIFLWAFVRICRMCCCPRQMGNAKITFKKKVK